jgi:membrane-bound ClpP family serine protease
VTVPPWLLAIVAALIFAGGVMAGALLGELSRTRRRRRLPTNFEAVVGRRVKALTPLVEAADGVVLLTGEHWKARTASGQLPAGAEARVVAVDGLCLIVVPAEGSLT